MKKDADNKKQFREYFSHSCDANEDDKIRAVYSMFKRAGRDLILNQIFAKLGKLGIDELELNELTYCSFADPELSPDKVKEIILFCVSIGLFQRNENTFWNIRALKQKIERLTAKKKKSDFRFYGYEQNKDRVNTKYQKELENIYQILARPLNYSDTIVIQNTEKSDNFDTIVIQS